MGKFLPLTPKRFVRRPVEENPWNANMAMALGKSCLLTDEAQFPERYFSTMDALEKRDVHD